MTIKNRSLGANYQLLETLTVGIVLKGWEVKAIRAGQVSLTGSFVKIIDGQMWLVNLTIRPPAGCRVRSQYRLLATRQQIKNWQKQDLGKTTVVVVAINCQRHIKLVLARARGLKKYDKRQRLAERDSQRQIQRRLKSSWSR